MNKKILIIMLLMIAITNATITGLNVSTPATLKAGEAFTINVSYNSTSNSNTTLSWGYSNPEIVSCSTNSCLLQFSRTAPNLFGENFTISVQVNDSNDTQEIIKNIQTQKVLLTLNATSANATQTTTASGSVKWEDGTPINTFVSIDFGGLKTITTNANGNYSVNYVLPEFVESGEYTITSTILTPTPVLSDDNIIVAGRTEGSLSLSPSYVQSLDSTLTTSFSYSHNTPNNYNVTLNVLGETLSSTELTHSFQLNLPNATAGEYEINALAEWINDDGTPANATTSVPLIISSDYNLLVNYSFNNSFSMKTDTHELFKINITNNGNTPITPDYSMIGSNPEWFRINTTGRINVGETKELLINLSIPYEANAGGYKNKLMITTPSEVIPISFDVTIISPSFSFDQPTTEKVVDNSSNVQIIYKVINNGQANVEGLHFNTQCPQDWVCNITNETRSLAPNDYFSTIAKIGIINPESVENKEVTITATDKAGRKITTTTNIKVRADSTKLITQPNLVYVIESPDYTENTYYAATTNGLIRIENFSNLSAVIPRTERSSELSAWTVQINNNTKGLGTICDASLIIGDKKYDLTNNTVGLKQALVGSVGSKVYEVYHFRKTGECVLSLDYGNGKQTKTYLVITGKNPEVTTSLTAGSITNIVNQAVNKSKKDEQMILKYIVYAFVITSLLVLGRVLYKKRKLGFVYEDTPVDKFVNKFNEKIKGGEESGKKGFYD